MVFRIGSAGTTTTADVRIFGDATLDASTNTLGALLWTGNFTGGSFVNNQPYTFQLTVSDLADDAGISFAASLFNAGTDVQIGSTRTWDATNAYAVNAPDEGLLGLRLGSRSSMESPRATIWGDNFSVIPEPSTLLLLIAAGAGLAAILKIKA